eukprot:3938256-Rhodomonas_salina.1
MLPPSLRGPSWKPAFSLCCADNCSFFLLANCSCLLQLLARSLSQSSSEGLRGVRARYAVSGLTQLRCYQESSGGKGGEINLAEPELPRCLAKAAWPTAGSVPCWQMLDESPTKKLEVGSIPPLGLRIPRRKRAALTERILGRRSQGEGRRR